MAGEAGIIRSSSRKLGAPEQRRILKLELVNLIEKLGKPLIPKVVAVFGQQTGLTFPRIRVYLNELVAAGILKVDGDKVSAV